MVLGSFIYIMSRMSGERVPEYSAGFLCIYPEPYVRWEDPRM